VRVRLRLVLLLLCALAAGTIDLAVKAGVSTQAWELHHRSGAWTVLMAVLLTGLLVLVVLPSRLVAVSAGVVAGGVLGNLASAVAHGGRVANPLAAGDVAFNLADVFVVAAVPVLMVALARVTVRHRDRIDRLIPPRRWELALRRRLGL
jgi:lipoprotein signal peptidase